MGLTKQYLRFTASGIFGIVASRSCNAVFLQPSKFVASGGTNLVTLWDTRFGRKLRTLDCESPAVVLQPNNDSTLLAVGHMNGGVSIYDLKDKSDDASCEPNVTFDGHRSEIASLCWDDSGTILASGSKDTKVIIWDCVSETGITKLKGHKAPVTRVRFWKESKYVLSSSMDSTLRIWNMITYDCVHTIAGNSQIWDFFTWSDKYIFIAESNIRLLRIGHQNSSVGEEFSTFEEGTILRHSTDRRTSHLNVIDNRYLIVMGPKSSEVEVFRLSNSAEATKRRKKRLKKHPDGSQSKEFVFKDLVHREESLRTTEGNVKSIDVIKEKDIVKILCCLPSNQMELLTYDPALHGQNKQKLLDGIKKPKPDTDILGFDGHAKLIRGIAFSSDKTAILTASADACKIWSRETLSCILTIKHEHPISCCKFCPGDRHFIAGTTNGQLILGDVSKSELIQIEEIGEEQVWAIDVFSNGRGFALVVGNAVQFYDFLMADGKLKFELKREFQIGDTTTCLKISANMKFIAVGLLDNTIKVFYLDTLKLHVSMYGHSLPTSGIDISTDSSLLVSCAGDKTIRVWGLDFGDCRCTKLHSAGLIGCSFIENTHHIVSVASDSINFYDGDNHERIQTIHGHTDSGASCMAIGGLHIVSAGRDQAIRIFSRTQEILVLSDEREQEREKELEKESIRENPHLPSLQTADTEKHTDKLIEALDVFKEKPTTDPLMQAYGSKDYKEFIYKVFSSIKASEMEQSLMLLPISYIYQMIPAINVILTNYPLATELAIKLLHALMKFHLPSLSSVEKNKLQVLSELAVRRLKELKDTVGFNMAGLKFLNNKKLEVLQIETYRELIGERKRKKNRKEKALKRALLTMV